MVHFLKLEVRVLLLIDTSGSQKIYYFSCRTLSWHMACAIPIDLCVGGKKSSACLCWMKKCSFKRLMCKTGRQQEKYIKVMYPLNPESEVYEDLPSVEQELLLKSL